jgi:hypothetical protein
VICWRLGAEWVDRKDGIFPACMACMWLFIAIEPRWTENENDDLTVWPRTEVRSRCADPTSRLRGADVGWGIVFGRLVCEPFADLGMVRIVWYWNALPITQPVPSTGQDSSPAPRLSG